MNSTSGNAASFCARAGKKCGRDIAERVGMQAALEQRQNLRRQSAGARADFQNAQAASFRQTSRCRAHRRGDGREPVAGEETVAIKMIEQLRADPGEQNLHGIFFAAQNRSQLSTVSFAKERFGKMSGMLLDVVAQNFLGGICRFSKTRRRLPIPLSFSGANHA